MTRRLGLTFTSFFCVVLTAMLALIGQVGPDPQLDPWRLTVSDYAVMDRGGVTDTAMVFFGTSALLLVVAIRGATIGRIALAVFGVAMLVAAIAPTDFGQDLSTVGYVHRYASMIAFVVLPVGALLLRPDSRAVRWTAWVSAALMLTMLVSATAGDRVLIGLVERLLLTAELVLLGLLAYAELVAAGLARRGLRDGAPLSRTGDHCTQGSRASFDAGQLRRCVVRPGDRASRRVRPRATPSPPRRGGSR